MTDDEINRKVAEIEGWRNSEACAGKIDALRYWERDGNNAPSGFYGESIPYATDWQWCGPLIEKYELTVERFPVVLDDGQKVVRYGASAPGTCMSFPLCDTPQRAICLAVIAANSERG